MVLTTAEMESLKTDRSTQRRKVSTLANRLKKGIQTGILNLPALESVYAELQTAYLDFLATHDEYAEEVEKLEEEEKVKYQSVNDLNLEQYTETVKIIYEDAEVAFGQKAERMRMDVKDEKNRIAIQEVSEEIGEVEKKVQNIINRVDCCFVEEGDSAELM